MNAGILLGQVSNEDLAAYWEKADLQIFRLIEISGDIEGSEMLAIEAVAQTTAIVGSVKDTTSELNRYLVGSDRYSFLAERIIRILNLEGPIQKQCIKHARQFEWAPYSEIFWSLIENKICEKNEPDLINLR